MNIENTNYIVNLAVETALTFYKEQVEAEKQKQLDNRLKNTKLLLKNYRHLKQHTDSIRLEIDELNEIIILDDINSETAELESIKESKRRTIIMIKYVAKMLELYESINGRRYNIIKCFYIDEEKTSVKDLADYYQVTTRFIYRELNNAVIEISSLLWGISSLFVQE